MDAGVNGEKELSNQKPYEGRPHIYSNRISSRHDNRANILFFDGHVDPVRASEVVTADGLAFFPQTRVIWTCDPAIDPNL